MLKVANLKLENGPSMTALVDQESSEVVKYLVNSWSWRGIEWIKFNGKTYRMG